MLPPVTVPVAFAGVSVSSYVVVVRFVRPSGVFLNHFTRLDSLGCSGINRLERLSSRFFLVERVHCLQCLCKLR